MDLGVECFQVEFGFRGLWVRIWGSRFTGISVVQGFRGV